MSEDQPPATLVPLPQMANVPRNSPVPSVLEGDMPELLEQRRTRAVNLLKRKSQNSVPCPVVTEHRLRALPLIPMEDGRGYYTACTAATYPRYFPPRPPPRHRPVLVPTAAAMPAPPPPAMPASSPASSSQAMPAPPPTAMPARPPPGHWDAHAFAEAKAAFRARAPVRAPPGFAPEPSVLPTPAFCLCRYYCDCCYRLFGGYQ